MKRLKLCKSQYIRIMDVVACCPFFLAICLILMASPYVYSATYYVSMTGQHSNPGTEARPWRTVQHAANKMRAGDTVYVKAGTYNERVTLSHSGNASQGYIVFQNYENDKPILDGNGLGNGDMITGSQISYVKIKGFHITNHIGAGIVFRGGGSHLEISNNEISNQTHQRANGHGIWITGQMWPGPVNHTYSDLIVDGNHLHDLDTGVNSAYNEALTLSFGIERFQITNNIIDNTNHIGIDLIGDKYHFPKYGIIAHNTVQNTGSQHSETGIYLDGAKHVVIESNKVFNVVGHGIVVSTEQTNFTTENIIVRWNETWDSTRNISPGGTSFGSSERVRVVHNVLYVSGNRTRGGIPPRNLGLYKGNNIIIKNNISVNRVGSLHTEHYIGTEFSPTLDANCYFPASAFFQYKGRFYNNFDAFQSQSGQGANSIAEDPLFVNAASRDFHLQSNSPVIDAGQFLTQTTQAGQGMLITVRDVDYFSDGHQVTGGDWVQVGSNEPVQVVAVDYNSHTLTVNKVIEWQANEGVSYPYVGAAPDMGVYEYGGVTIARPTLPLPTAPPPMTPALQVPQNFRVLSSE